MSSPTVLLVESHEDSRTIYAAVLRHHGYGVLAGACADEALRVAESERVDLVVTEFSPPRANSLQAVRALRTHPVTQNAPLLVLSTTVDHADRDQLLAEGAAVYLVKPCSPLALLEQARRLLAR